jgi:putative endonuclease
LESDSALEVVVKGITAPTRIEVGATGERLAVNYLKGLGYQIQHRNFRCRQGEVDIIARHDDCLVFVEVRTKRSGEFGTPEESITSAKKEKLIALAEAYLQTLSSQPLSWRIDVVAVELALDGGISRLDHIENAVN